MKKIYSLFAAVLFTITASAQTTIYTENMGTPTTTTAISANTFQNGSPISYSGTADVRVSSASSGYTGASGGGNIFFTGTAGTNFIISGINTSSYSNIQLSFGQLKTTNASSNELTVEVSSDGSTWTPLTYTRATGSGTANTYIIITPTGTIPSTSTLSIKFTNTITGNWRIDDLKLTGTSGTLAVTDLSNAKGANFVKNTFVKNDEITFGADAKDMKIYNMLGQIVKTASVKENESVNVAELKEGNYIVTGVVNGKKVSQKIIKR